MPATATRQGIITIMALGVTTKVTDTRIPTITLIIPSTHTHTSIISTSTSMSTRMASSASFLISSS
jgi:hypothetical protein